MSEDAVRISVTIGSPAQRLEARVHADVMDLTMVTGLAAGMLTTIAFLPQLIQTWKTRSAKDVSLGMFLIFTAGVLLWVIYGVMIRSIPIISANTVTLVLAGAILVLKLRYG